MNTIVINVRQQDAQPERPWISSRLRLAAQLMLLVLAYLLADLQLIDRIAVPWVRMGVHLLLLCAVFSTGYRLISSRLRNLETPAQRIARRVDDMQPLVDVTLDIVSVLDETQVLEHIACRAAKLVSAPAAFVFLPDREENVMRVVTQCGFRPDLVGATFPPGRGVTGMVWQTKAPVVVNGYQQWDNRGQNIIIEPLDSIVGVPLLWKGEVIGTLAVGDESHRTFTEAEAMLLQPFADLASIAINNSRLYGYVSRLTRELEQRDAVKTFQLSQTQEELSLKAAQLQGLFKRMTELQESERARISRDMHDSTTQLILGAVYTTQAAMSLLERADHEAAREKMRAVQILLHEIEKEIREAIRNLRPIMLDQEGVAAATKQYLARTADLTRLKYEFRLNGTPVRLEEQTEVAIYRIVQEALQNITTHARASKACVSMAFLTDSVQITIEDDGTGFEYHEAAQQESRHFGLVGMRERADSIGANFAVQSSHGQGTRLTLDVPIHPVGLIERGF